jgi:hypothetical protein
MPLIRTKAFLVDSLKTSILKNRENKILQHKKANATLPSEIFAPDFELYSTPNQKLKLSELRNRKVVLAFYPAD